MQQGEAAPARRAGPGARALEQRARRGEGRILNAAFIVGFFERGLISMGWDLKNAAFFVGFLRGAQGASGHTWG